MWKKLLVLLLPASMATAQNANLGTAGAQFLQIPVGAKAASMGGAYVATAGDASVVFWNVAGIAGVKGQSVFFSHTPWWATTRLNSAAYVLNLGDVGVIGASMTALSMDEMEVTTETRPDGTGELFDAQDLMIGVSYARALTDRFKAGITAKYIQQSIWNESASAIGFDIGTQYTLWFNSFTIGMSLTNFGGDLKLEGRDLDYKLDRNTSLPKDRLLPVQLQTEDYPLPLHFQIGVSMELIRSDPAVWHVAMDVAHPNDNYERVNIGTEVQLFRYLALRGGYRYNYDDEDLTLGFGVALPIGESKVSFDYGYGMYELLPDVQRFSVGIDF